MSSRLQNWSKRMQPTEFYVYAHRKASSREIFYIGKGKGKRAFEEDRNDLWKKTKKKHGLLVQILCSGLVESDAFELEMLAIEMCGASKLTNMTLGGEGSSGFKHTQAARRKIGTALKGNQHLRNHKHSDETRTKMSESQKARITPEDRARKSASMLGRVMTQEHRAKLSAANKGRRPSEACLLAVAKSNKQRAKNVHN